MSRFRSIIAVLLAILVVSPLCCCAAMASDSQTASSCCIKSSGENENQDQKVPDSHVCNCKSKEPRDEAKAFSLPSDLMVPFVPLAEEILFPARTLPVRSPMVNTPHTGSDPPRLLLARYSRWLI